MVEMAKAIPKPTSTTHGNNLWTTTKGGVHVLVETYLPTHAPAPGAKPKTSPRARGTENGTVPSRNTRPVAVTHRRPISGHTYQSTTHLPVHSTTTITSKRS